MSRQRALEFIKGLTNKQLVEFMNEALAGRRSDEGLEKSFVQEHWCLAEASRMLEDDDITWGKWEVNFLAEHDRDEYPGEWHEDSPLCQEGTCTNCGYDSIGWAKKNTCPICGTLTYAT